MRVNLKVLNEESGKTYDCKDNPDRCSVCPINVGNGGRCLGCSDEKLYSCGMRGCMQGCGTCGGHKVAVPAICCKSPVATTYLIQAAPKGNYKDPKFTFTAQKPIRFESKAVVSARGGGINSSIGSPYLDSLECVAATIKDVWSSNGFYSKDIKDYLRIPKSKKLIILNALLDDWLERMWDAEAFGNDFAEHGIDYWAPPAFSIYVNDGRMHAYWQTLRTFRALQIGQGHFVPLSSTTGLKFEDVYLEALDKVPQAILNCQFGSNKEAFKNVLMGIKYWHQLVKPHVSFWLVGVGTPGFCHNVRKVLGTREAYFISANPFRLANHGKLMKPDGNGVKKKDMAKQELLHRNQAVFTAMVKQWG